MQKHTIVITGAGTGLGKLAAIALARRGHKVYASVHYCSETNSLNKIANEENIDLIAFKLDILSKDDRQVLLHIDFDTLINNAAIGESGSVLEICIDRIKNVFETNVFQTIAITQIALKNLIYKKCGRIIFISSLVGRITMPWLSPYCASKFALESFATSLKKEMKLLNNIQIGIIEPGAYATGFNEKNNEKKFVWMKKKSYFKSQLNKIQIQEKKKFNFLEGNNFDSIIKKYIRAVEDKTLKARYSAPKLQSFFIQLQRIFGF
ncbi:MAG: SDR family NAD(P)-dependent oxidoreductase [Clostridia bacterium]